MRDSLFEDGKDPGAFRTIGEVSAALDIKPHVLRCWEEQFPTLRPVKRSGGRRYYRPGDVALLQQIDRLLNQDGYTIKGAVKAIDDAQRKPPVTPAPVPQPAASPSPALVQRLKGAVRALEESTGDLPPAIPADRMDEVVLRARLRAIRARLANALG